MGRYCEPLQARLRSGAVLAGWLVLTAAASSAQPPRPAVAQQLLVEAFDKQDQPVTDLRKDELLIEEDGRAVVIQDLTPAADTPLVMAIAADVSGSTVRFWGPAKPLLLDFIHTQLRNPQSSIMFSFFANRPSSTPLTRGPKVLEEALDDMKIGGDTALFDAVVEASSRLPELMNGVPTRRVIVLLSDGDDNQSRSTLQTAIGAAQQHGVAVLAMREAGYYKPAGSRGERNLRGLAENTGGEVLPARDPKELAAGFSRLTDELASQYVVTYSSVTTRPGKLAIKSTGRQLKFRASRFGATLAATHK